MASTRKLILVKSHLISRETSYIQDFLSERGIKYEWFFPGSSKGKSFRALFDDKDDTKVVPFIVVLESEDGGDEVILFKAARPKISKLYKAMLKYINGNEES